MSYPGAPPISAQSGAQDRNRVPQQPANTSTYAMYGTASQYAGMTPQPQHFPASSPSHLQATPQVTVTTTQPQKTKKNLTVQKKNHGPQTPAKAPPKPKSQISPVPQVSKPSEPSDIVVDTTAPPGDANPCPPPSKRIRAPATTESGPLQSLALGGASTNPQPTSVATHLVPSPTSIQSTELSMGEGNVAAPPGPPLRVPLPGVDQPNKGEKPDMEPKRLSQLQNMLGDQLTAMSKSFCSQTDVIKNQAISHLTERSELDVSSQTMLDDLAGKATSLLQLLGEVDPTSLAEGNNDEIVQQKNREIALLQGQINNLQKEVASQQMSDQGTKEELNRVQLQRREEARQREAEKAATDKATEEAFQRYRNMVAAAEKRAEQALAQNHELQHSFEIHQSQMESARNAIALHQQQSREKDEQIEKLKKELDETSAREKALAEQLENTQKELEKQKRKWTQVLASIQSSE